MKEIVLNRPQWEVIQSQAQETFLVAGLGTGKSFILGALSYIACRTSGGLFGLFAPDKGVLKRSTLPQVQEAWERMEFYEGEHYVVNRRPPKHWGVKPFSSLNSTGILTTIYGSYVILDGLDNFNAQRGTQYDEIWVDEFRDVREQARLVLIGRLRGKRYTELGKQQRITYATTPPDNPTYLKKLSEKKDPSIKFIQGTSYDNQANLPDGYIEKLTGSLDDLTLKREVFGELAMDNTNRFITNFNPGRHLAELEIAPNLPLYLSFDFNMNPMTAILAQHTYNKIYIIREFRQMTSDAEVFAEYIRKQLPRTRNIFISGDASANKSINAYKMIARILGLSKSNIKVLKKNPFHFKSRILCNSLFSKHPELLIDQRCKYLIEDIERVQFVQHPDKVLQIDKSDQSLTHLLDCMRYYFQVYHSNFIDRAHWETETELAEVG